jgi:hypothetical protein
VCRRAGLLLCAVEPQPCLADEASSVPPPVPCPPPAVHDEEEAGTATLSLSGAAPLGYEHASLLDEPPEQQPEVAVPALVMPAIEGHAAVPLTLEDTDTLAYTVDGDRGVLHPVGPQAAAMIAHMGGKPCPAYPIHVVAPPVCCRTDSSASVTVF